MQTASCVLVTGGAGYVGSCLVPQLLRAGHQVRVLDLFLYGRDVFAAERKNPRFREYVGDIRSAAAVAEAATGCSAVIHLACVSNDPSFDLDPDLGRAINFECFRQLVRTVRDAGVRRFIYASSSSVYGVREEDEVTENLPLRPLTDYSKYKALCEDILHEERQPGFATVVVRPATVCGYAPRLRLDLTVNILTNHAVNRGLITVFGGEQLRPNLHVEDMAEVYLRLLAAPERDVDGKVWNVGRDNLKVREIAERVRRQVGPGIEIAVTPTNDRRSYHVSSERIARELGYRPRRSVDEAIIGLKQAFSAGLVPDPLGDRRYYNIRRMQELGLR